MKRGTFLVSVLSLLHFFFFLINIRSLERGLPKDMWPAWEKIVLAGQETRRKV